MLDKYKRKINYLRISVTDRCNLRCRYCMPACGVEWVAPDKIITYEEIIESGKILISYGIDKIRLTGGEPLVRKDITKLIAGLSEIKGIKDLALTTNGILLKKNAQALADAGLHRVNISLDTVNPVKFKRITRGGDINTVFEGIEAAKKAGLFPVKVNCVIGEFTTEKDAQEVRAYCLNNGLEPRYISEMSLADGNFGLVDGGTGGDCEHCNRLRLTSTGMFKPCLFSDLEYDLRSLGIEKAFKMAIEAKPEKGCKNHTNFFSNIGG